MSGQQPLLANGGEPYANAPSYNPHATYVPPPAYAPAYAPPPQYATHEQYALQAQYGAPSAQYATPAQYVPVEGHSHHQKLMDPVSPPSDPYYTPSVQSGPARFQPVSGCRDLFWSLLFIAHIIGMVVLTKMVYHSAVEEYDNQNNNNNNNDDDSDRIQLTGRAYEVLVFLVLIGVFASLAWLGAFKSYPRGVIYAAIIFSVTYMVSFAVYAFEINQAIVGLIFLLCAAVNAIYFYVVRARIPFTAHLLSIVSSLLRRFPTTSVIAIVAAAVQIAWSALWTIAAVGAISELRDQSSGRLGAALFFLLVSFYWSLQVVRNVVHVTVAGLMASWYFLPADGMPKHPTLGAFRRATWSSFGSICFGSLVISFFQALRTFLNILQSADNEWVRCIVQCILSCVESAIEYFNAYAFTQIAIYGKTYCQASSDALSLLKSSGIDATINDNLTDAVLFFASFTTGVVGAIVGGLLADFMLHTSSVWYVWSAAGFLIASSMSIVMLELVSSAVMSFFVCFAEDPDMLRQTKPDIYHTVCESLAGRWTPPRVENANNQI